jgi:hypothetical protein
MTDVHKDLKTIAKYAASAFGTAPKVLRFWDEGGKSMIDMAACADSPWEGVTSYSTIGLSQYPIIKDGRDYGVRTEVVGACESGRDEFANCLSTVAFNIINSRFYIGPGIIFKDVLSMYRASKTMKHIFFLPPFLWDGKLETLDLSGKKVAWLMAIPISDAEMRFADERGASVLESKFEEAQIDVFDLDRESVV